MNKFIIEKSDEVSALTAFRCAEKTEKQVKSAKFLPDGSEFRYTHRKKRKVKETIVVTVFQNPKSWKFEVRREHG